MKNSKSNFDSLLTKMDKLSEKDQGKLKGGFLSVQNNLKEEDDESNTVCPDELNLYKCQ